MSTKTISEVTSLTIQPNINSANKNVHAFYVPYLTTVQRDILPQLNEFRDGAIVLTKEGGFDLGTIGNTHIWYRIITV